MKVTALTAQKNSERINLYADGEFLMGLPLEAILEFKLKKGSDLDEETIKQLKRFGELDKVKSSALNYLSYRQRTVHEIKNYLLRKEFDESLIDKAISQLLEVGYLDDEKFASSYIDEKTRINSLGSQRLKYELRKKGIEDEIINNALSEVEPDLDELESLVRRKYSKVLSEDKNTQFRKIGGYLQRKGYGYDVIKKVLEKLNLGED